MWKNYTNLYSSYINLSSIYFKVVRKNLITDPVFNKYVH